MDSQQHKVIVTGNVEADTLIKKLLRSGKHAELWPEKKEKKSGKSKNNKDQKNIEEEGDGEQKNTDGSNGGIGKDTDGGDTDKDEESEEVGGENVGGNSGGGGGGGGGGGKKKRKKKKKGQNGNSLNGDGGGNSGGGGGSENFSDVLPGGGSPMSPHDMAPPMEAVNLSPPHQHMYPYPPMNYPPQVPYGMSYNMAYPSASNASYYVPPMHANRYSHHGIYGPPPPPPLPSDPIYTHSDYDDESSCSIM